MVLGGHHEDPLLVLTARSFLVPIILSSPTLRYGRQAAHGSAGTVAPSAA